MPVLSRIAPTPSGFIHKGNAFNFLLTWEWVKRFGGKVFLRIDDLDVARCREEYLRDIFEVMALLKIEFDGPSGVEDFQKNFTQSKNRSFYDASIEKLWGQNALYACECSRKQILERSPSGVYPGTCREKKLKPTENRSLRFRSSGELKQSMGDFVVRQKGGAPAYQIVSVCEDSKSGVNLIVRGEDLRESTLAQQALAHALGLEGFLKARVIHHPLLLDAHGEKLSKSTSKEPYLPPAKRWDLSQLKDAVGSWMEMYGDQG